MRCVHCHKDNALHHVTTGSGSFICGSCANHTVKLKLNSQSLGKEKKKEEFTREKVIFT